MASIQNKKKTASTSLLNDRFRSIVTVFKGGYFNETTYMHRHMDIYEYSGSQNVVLAASLSRLNRPSGTPTTSSSSRRRWTAKLSLSVEGDLGDGVWACLRTYDGHGGQKSLDLAIAHHAESVRVSKLVDHHVGHTKLFH